MDKFVTIDHFDQFSMMLREERNSDKEVAHYMDDVKEFFGWVRQDEKIDDLRKITPEVLEFFREFQQSNKYTLPEVNAKIKHIKAFFVWLFENDIVRHDPFAEEFQLKERRIPPKKIKPSSESWVKIASGIGMLIVVSYLLKPWLYFDSLFADINQPVTNDVVFNQPRRVIIGQNGDIPQDESYDLGALLTKFSYQSEIVDAQDGAFEIYVAEPEKVETWWQWLWKLITGGSQMGLEDTSSSSNKDEFLSPVAIPRSELNSQFQLNDEELFSDEAEYQQEVRDFLNASKEVIEIETNHQGLSMGFIDTKSDYAVLVEPTVGMNLFVGGQIINGGDEHVTYVVSIGVNQASNGLTVYGRTTAGVVYDLAMKQRLGGAINDAINEFDSVYAEAVGDYVHTVIIVTYDDANGDHEWGEGELVLPIEGLKVKLVKVK